MVSFDLLRRDSMWMFCGSKRIGERMEPAGHGWSGKVTIAPELGEGNRRTNLKWCAKQRRMKLLWLMTDPMIDNETTCQKQSTACCMNSCEETGSGGFTKPLDVHGCCFSCLPVRLVGKQAG